LWLVPQCLLNLTVHALSTTATIYSEEELILLLKQQSREGFNYLYRQYGAVLYGIINKVVYDEQTAQDVLQDVFVKIWNNIEQYNPQKGRLYTWMINIARNASIDKLRSKGEIMKGKIRTGDDVVNNLHEGMKTEQATDTIGLRKMVAGLKPEYEAIITLAYFKGFTLDEISKALEMPLGTVKTRMRAAIHQLREIFNN
jgi:RNA polymerase sigma-70 factor (ECF subfamily)